MFEREREKEREKNSGRMIAYGLDLSCTRASFVPSVDQARKRERERETEMGQTVTE